MRISLLTVVNVGLTADRADHVTDVTLTNDDFKMMLKTVATDATLTAGRVQHLNIT